MHPLHRGVQGFGRIERIGALTKRRRARKFALRSINLSRWTVLRPLSLLIRCVSPS